MVAQHSRSMLAKASDILGVFSGEQPSLSQAEITRRAELSHSTTRRLVAEMVEHGLLEKTEDGQFMIGLRLWELGSLSHRVFSLRDIAMPFMTVLNQALGQHVQLVVREGQAAIVVDRLSATNAVALQMTLRNRLSLHASGAGRTLLAFAPEPALEKILAEPLEEFTALTVTDPDKLRGELERIKQQGYAVVSEETQLGVVSIAAPIRTPRRKVIASLSVAVPPEQADVEKLVYGVIAAAKAISAAL